VLLCVAMPRKRCIDRRTALHCEQFRSFSLSIASMAMVMAGDLLLPPSLPCTRAFVQSVASEGSDIHSGGPADALAFERFGIPRVCVLLCCGYL
jgi:hypothetical protein